MESLMYTDCSSYTKLPLIHLNHRNSTFLCRPCFDQLRLRTTVPGRGRSRSSPILAFSSAGDSESFAKEIGRKSVAEKIRDEIKIEMTRMEEPIKAFVKRIFGDQVGDELIDVVPGLAAVLIFGNRYSATHVEKRWYASESVGITLIQESFNKDSSEEEVLEYISFVNNSSVHGIIVSLPLPLYVNEEKILNAISIEKKIEGFHPRNTRLLPMLGKIKPLFSPKIANECVRLLRRSNVEIKGKKVVVIGWTNNIEIRGKIRAAARMFLKKEGAAVTVIHSKTKKRVEIVREADIIISAADKPNLVRGSWIKPGVVILGINPIEDRNAPDGYRLVGDVCYEEASKVASTIMPLPGGVERMTTAMVLFNIFTATKKK